MPAVTMHACGRHTARSFAALRKTGASNRLRLSFRRRALLLRDDGNRETLGYVGPAIGLFEDAAFATIDRRLSGGDTLLMLTDGITEAFNIDGRVFTPDRVLQGATRRKFESATDLVQSLFGEVSRFSEGTEQSDDITCVALRFKNRRLGTRS